MSQFILFLHENPQDFADVSPEQMQAVIQEYTAWREQLVADNRLSGANKLKDEGGRWLTAGNGATRVIDGPYSEAKEVVGGYFIIEAVDYDEAVKISSDCPHLRYGGRIELREIDAIHD
jgi:hypothetical protein